VRPGQATPATFVMNPFSSHHARPDDRHGLDTVRRVTAVVAVFVVVIGAPLVVRALADDSEEDSLSTQGAVEMSDQPSFESRRSRALDEPIPFRPDDPGATVLPTVERADDESTSEADATAVDTIPDDVAPDRVAAPPVDILALVTAPYSWDERSLRVAALQQILNVSVDGWYSPDTRQAHLEVLEFLGLDTDEVPDVAPPGPSSEQWAALRSCESGGDYSIVSSSGRYRGAYQFARATWDSVAERQNPSLVGVDPATASAAEQDAMALALYREAGAGPWPVCGRHLR